MDVTDEVERAVEKTGVTFGSVLRVRAAHDGGRDG